MKRKVCVLSDRCVVACFLTFTLLAGVSCSDGHAPQAQPVAHEPLPAYAMPLDDEPPLLLDDELLPVADEGVVAFMAVNGRCFVCHISYIQEELAVTHARAGMGCAQCHGESDAHIDDESWTSGGKGTAPDRIYAPQEVDRFCMACHAGDTFNDDNHTPPAADQSQKQRCTDCHGSHLLNSRVTEWK